MNIATIHMQNEISRLSPFAMPALHSKGRKYPLTPCELRTPFQRDRDRIIHCKSFRRLKDKTQVFLSPQGDHYRTRLTHTLEVSQISRTIANALNLNENLTEAIALGHDLGHTPFGHVGEKSLNNIMPNGFIHNEQSVRVVEKLERNGKGLNLTYEVIDGIRYHSGKTSPCTLEGMCVSRADRIAYINHDIDDAIRGGILSQEDLPKECINVLGDTHGKRINTMITDIVTNSFNLNKVEMSSEIKEATDLLRSFLFEHVYHDSWRKEEERRCDYIINELFHFFEKHPERLPEEFLKICEEENTKQAVCDFIACMTDRYAITYFNTQFVPHVFVHNTTSFPLEF